MGLRESTVFGMQHTAAVCMSTYVMCVELVIQHNGKSVKVGLCLPLF
jgi:hypothetical protein